MACLGLKGGADCTLMVLCIITEADFIAKVKSVRIQAGQEAEREGAAAAFTWVKSAFRVNKHAHKMCTKSTASFLKDTHGLITLPFACGVS